MKILKSVVTLPESFDEPGKPLRTNTSQSIIGHTHLTQKHKKVIVWWSGQRSWA